MNVQYLSDDNGQVTAVQVPIEDWERLKLVHPDINDIDSPLPKWQTELIDQRLKAIKENPGDVKPIAGLLNLINSVID